MNWLNKLDELLTLAKTSASLYWEVAFFVALVFTFIAYLIGRRDDSLRVIMRGKMRIFRYCHNCTYCDLPTETCAIGAAVGEKCALVDDTAGIEWTIPTKVP